MSTDGAVQALRDRLARFEATGDRSLVAGAGLGDELRRFALHPTMNGDIEGLHAAAWLSWYRATVGGDPGCRSIAMQIFTALYTFDPNRVPPELRAEIRAARVRFQEKVRDETPDAVRIDPGGGLMDAAIRAMETDDRSTEKDDTGLLEDSVVHLRRMRDQTPAVKRPLADVMLGIALCRLQRRTGDPTLLDECVEVLRRGLRGLPSTEDERPAAQRALASALMARYLASRDPALVAEASALVSEADRSAARVSADASELASMRVDPELLEILAVLPELADPAAPDRSERIDGLIARCRAHLASMPAGHPRRHEAVQRLGVLLAAVMETPGGARTASLEQAAAVLREAVAASPPRDPNLPLVRMALGAVLSEAALRAGRAEVSDEGLDELADAAGAIDPKQPVYPAVLSGLAVGHWKRYLMTEELRHLDEAIALGRRALEPAGQGGAIRPAVAMNLAAALLDRYRQTGAAVALDESITLAREALGDLPAGSHEHRIAANTLSAGLSRHYERTGDRRAAAESLELARAVVRGVPRDRPEWIGHAVGLGQALGRAAEASGDLGHETEGVALLREAVRESRDVRDLCHASSALGIALLDRFRRAGAAEDLDEAVTVLDHAARQDGAAPERVDCVGLLGTALQMRASRTRGRADLARAADALDRAATAVRRPSPRLAALRALGDAAADLGDAERACAAFERAVAELARLAPGRLTRADSEHELGRVAGLATDAAACALAAGRPKSAVELLEQGRGLLLTKALDLRGDIDGLRERAPDLARRFTAVRDRMDATDRPGDVPGREAAPLGDGAVRQAERRDRLASEWDRCLEEIRAVPGFADFLRPPAFAELMAGLGGRTVAVVNPSRHRSDAILLHDGTVDVVRLGDGLHAAVRRAAAAFAPDSGALASDGALARLLAMLWDGIAEPVLERLGHTAPPPPGSAPPRLWWCPTGPLAALPLHAAGRYDGSGASVGDRVVSSYTPTIRSLSHAEPDPAPPMPRGDRVLLVAMAATPGERPLRAVAEERDWLRRRFPGLCDLFNEKATRDRVLAELPGKAVVHFACHGRADPEVPSSGALLLHDHQERPLTVARLARLDLPGALLAYLSACEAARTSLPLADEAVHAVTACRLAGFPHVIGSLWEVDDATSARMAQLVYEALAVDGLSGASVAAAVTGAARALREAGAGLRAWAPYVHVGS
ncbi:CHAT domain-containing protein [Actinomadura fibrosa]|uniref:CHAT domain-containing protein n=1 Tax=Actinomadura fibrosa TaxID=111802 RepID=A0ABW2XE95_9ACTN|nr:CHAT domain-containing protein [Actinomadura fibrosa]